jgi:hypothetical protein
MLYILLSECLLPSQHTTSLSTQMISELAFKQCVRCLIQKIKPAILQIAKQDTTFNDEDFMRNLNGILHDYYSQNGPQYISDQGVLCLLQNTVKVSQMIGELMQKSPEKQIIDNQEEVAKLIADFVKSKIDTSSISSKLVVKRFMQDMQKKAQVLTSSAAVPSQQIANPNAINVYEDSLKIPLMHK